MEYNRRVTKRDGNGNPMCNVIRLNSAFDGTMAKEELRQLIALTGLCKHDFWLTYLQDRCAYSSFKSWYLDSTKIPVPDFLLVYFTARWPALYQYCKEIYK